MSQFIPRPNQAEILNYTGGYMGVAAVPGSGKTWTLSVLASRLIAEGYLQDQQEILIVTLVNSAVDNFSRRIGTFVEEYGLLPQVGYHVRTLHGLAHDIVRERPGLVGLADDFRIIDERLGESIRKEVVLAWLKANPFYLDAYLKQSNGDDENRLNWIRREKLPDMANEVAMASIRYAKDHQFTPGQLRARLDEVPVPLVLAEMGLEIYEGYQRALTYRGAVDFDDLIRLALQALQLDSAFLERLRYRWPYVLEDEAQDSSLLQQSILELLAGKGGNWVRVGDPNQAIFETFTTANPQHLRDFIANKADFPQSLPHSGRSSRSIIDLANYLIHWTNEAHPVTEVRDALSPPFIQPTPQGDPQPNPQDLPEEIHLVGTDFTPGQELEVVANSVIAWLEENPEKTVAVLAPRNTRGFQLVDILRKRGIDPVDSLLRSSSTTRLAAGALANILQYLSDPKSARRLATVYKVWRRGEREDEEKSESIRVISGLIQKMSRVEDFISPRTGADWLAELENNGTDPEVIEHLRDFQEVILRWQGTVLLPADQMVLTIAQDLFRNTTELAIAHKLALLLGQKIRDRSDWHLPDFTEELSVIAKNERRFIGFSEEDSGFDPEAYPGRVVVATMHKAKGLEWDRVYLMSVNNYDFPSAQLYDDYISEKWFIRDSLNLQAEALAQLENVFSSYGFGWYEEGRATELSRLDYVKERLRLLYVGVTRAKQELIMTWNTGRRGESTQALPFVALQTFAKEQGYGNEG
ncbi:ATP-dependent helicase [bacterium]|nr:ATP-dependent helicase [bacterium]